MSLNKYRRGALAGSKLTSNGKPHCTGADYLEGEHKSIGLAQGTRTK
jgi:hypothetical protein